jgi:hypothetical protein
MHLNKRNLLISTLTIFIIISAFTLIPVANSQPLMEKLNLNENIEHKLKKELLESKILSISNNKSRGITSLETLISYEESLIKEFPILFLILLILASPILIPALYVVYLIFLFGVIIDLIKNIPEYESIWEIIRVFIFIIISPFGFPLFLNYLFILWISFLLQPQPESFTLPLIQFPSLKT